MDDRIECLLYFCHDYPVGDAQPLSKIILGELKATNVMLNAKTTEADFIAKRMARDKVLSVPKLLFQPIQTNMHLADFRPKSQTTGFQYLTIPIGMFDQEVIYVDAMSC